jgi:hypothetical protein
MTEKRLFILCSPGEFVKRQRRLGIPANIECLELLWMTEVIPRMKDRESILHLASTCRFFRDLFAAQTSVFWHQLCIKYYWNKLVFSPNINYKDIFISATLRLCIVCHEQAWSPIGKVDETTWTMCLHEKCKTPFPIVSVSKATKEYHISKKIVQTLPDVRPGANPRYFVADVQAAAYAHYGSKEKWDEKHAQLQKRHEALEKKKQADRCAEIKKGVDRVVVDLGPDFEFDDWQYPDVFDYISNGPSKWPRNSKAEQVTRLVRKELKYRLHEVVRTCTKKRHVVVTTVRIQRWLHRNPEKRGYFPAYV